MNAPALGVWRLEAAISKIHQVFREFTCLTAKWGHRAPHKLHMQYKVKMISKSDKDMAVSALKSTGKKDNRFFHVYIYMAGPYPENS